MSYGNFSEITTSGGLLATATAAALNFATLLLIGNGLLTFGRRKRDLLNHTLTASEENFLQQVLYKVLTDLDESGCSALALCHATSLPKEARSSNHSAIITMLSPQPGTPVPWADLHTPSAKYQYAAFIGLWAGLTENRSQCHDVFPTCPLSADDVIKTLANQQVPCGKVFDRENVIDD